MKGWLGELDEPVRKEIFALLLIGIAALSYFALFSSNPGLIGGVIQSLLRAFLGRTGAYIIPGFAGITGVLMLVSRQKMPLNRPRIIGVFMLVIVFLSYLHREVPGEPLWAYVRNGWTHQLGGGAIGGLLTVAFVGAFGQVGRDLLLATMAAVALPMIINVPLRHLTRQLFSRFTGATRQGITAIRDFVVEEVPVEEDAGPEDGAFDDVAVDDEVEEDDEPGPSTGLVEIESVTSRGLRFAPSANGHVNGQYEPDQDPDPELSPDPDEEPPVISSNLHGATGQAYRLPPVSLLKRGSTRSQRGSNRQQLRAKAAQLEETLASFGVKVKVTGIQEGPAVTRYELEPAVGVRVSKIQNLSSDIALSLAAPDVRIEAPIPGKSLIGIEVPNRNISPVYLRDVLDQPEFYDDPSQLTIALGKDIAGKPVITSLERMVHVLVAGATGSGKSVCINTFLASLLFKATPDQVRLLLIDPKMVELSGYNGIPHLLVPVVTDPKKAATSLKWLVREMNRRYHLFADASVRDIGRYNAQMKSLGQETLPYIVVVIDELADLMMVSPVDVEDAIQRLAQMARAAGIHLVVATQRPSVDVITGVIKANIPSRIAFAVSSQADSRVILDLAGAEKLVGKGDMLFYPMGAPKPVRVQGAFVSEPELESVLDFVRGQGNPEFDEEVLEAAEQPEGDISPGEEDELFVEALRLVLEAGQASVSMLQRRLRIGYTRAGRLVDMMEEHGFVGPHQGSKAREVLITMEDFRRMFEDA